MNWTKFLLFILAPTEPVYSCFQSFLNNFYLNGDMPKLLLHLPPILGITFNAYGFCALYWWLLIAISSTHLLFSSKKYISAYSLTTHLLTCAHILMHAIWLRKYEHSPIRIQMVCANAYLVHLKYRNKNLYGHNKQSKQDHTFTFPCSQILSLSG